MKKNDLSEPTLIDVFNFFFRSGFPSIIGDKATAVGLAIIFKWNSLMRPADFRMANSELESLSGCDSHLGRTRQKILDDCKIGGVPLFTYVSNGTRRAGTYRINTNLLPNYDQIMTKLTPNYGHIGNDLREETEEETEKDPPDYPIDGYIPEGKKAKGSLKGRSKEEIDFLWEGYEYYGYTRVKYDNELTRYGYDHMKECLDARIDQEEKGKQPEDPLAYMATIVRNKWMEKANG